MPLVRDISKLYTLWREQGWSIVKQRIGKRLLQHGSWSSYSSEAMVFASWMDFSRDDVEKSRQVQCAYPAKTDIQSLTWFLPEFQHPYYGGIFTLLRFADYFKRNHAVENRFMILGSMDPDLVAEKIYQGFPGLKGQPVQNFNLYKHIENLEPTDAGIASLWGTAYFLLRFNQTKRKFYFMQDYEPLFYPAGTIYAQVEASYRFGFYGIANTPTIKQLYEDNYGGKAEYFVPCVDTDMFYPAGQPHNPSEPWTIFFYGRPGHPRNGFELGAQALRLLKKRLGKRVRILAAGDRWAPRDYGLDGVVENLGLLEYAATADLYRSCHAGLVMMFTRHPSYLPLELMASGSLVVTNYNPASLWLLENNQNCLLSEASATCLAGVLEQALVDEAARQRITSNAVQLIQSRYSRWDQEIDKIFRYMQDPLNGAASHQ